MTSMFEKPNHHRSMFGKNVMTMITEASPSKQHLNLGEVAHLPLSSLPLSSSFASNEQAAPSRSIDPQLNTRKKL